MVPPPPVAPPEEPPPVIPPPPPPPPPPAGGGGGGGGAGGGGGGAAPNITLAALPRVGAQPLVFLYLSQIPYTGLELGPIGTILYWLALIVWSLALAYLVLFVALPFANRHLRSFGSRVSLALNANNSTPMSQSAGQEKTPPATPAAYAGQEQSESSRGYSSYEGFKSFAHNGALSIDDIVKGLTRNAEPVYEKVEPIYDNVEPIVNNAIKAAETESVSAPANIRGFISALVEGDRMAVFAGLRQHVRGGGAPEKLISDIVYLLDDAYRARIDGTDCDADVARMTARLDTPTLEKLVAALATAIDSSYSAGVTGAKLALTRALMTLGA